jgi:hypothetical protein
MRDSGVSTIHWRKRSFKDRAMSEGSLHPAGLDANGISLCNRDSGIFGPRVSRTNTCGLQNEVKVLLTSHERLSLDIITRAQQAIYIKDSDDNIPRWTLDGVMWNQALQSLGSMRWQHALSIFAQSIKQSCDPSSRDRSRPTC